MGCRLEYGKQVCIETRSNKGTIVTTRGVKIGNKTRNEDIKIEGLLCLKMTRSITLRKVFSLPKHDRREGKREKVKVLDRKIHGPLPY